MRNKPNNKEKILELLNKRKNISFKKYSDALDNGDSKARHHYCSISTELVHLIGIIEKY